MVEAVAHRLSEGQEAQSQEEHLVHLAAEQLVAGSTGSMPRNSGNLRRLHMDPDRRSIEHIEQHNQSGC